MQIVGDVQGRACIIVDDMIDTAGTMVKGVNLLRVCSVKWDGVVRTCRRQRQIPKGTGSADSPRRCRGNLLKAVYFHVLLNNRNGRKQRC